MFSNLFSSSISLATVTPSLVTVGAPHDFSITTLRPRGPRVTLTALARVFTPCRICVRACSSKRISLADIVGLLRSVPGLLLDDAETLLASQRHDPQSLFLTV